MGRRRKSAAVVAILECIADRWRENFALRLHAVGSVSSFLSGVKIEPRDVDLYLPREVSYANFESMVLGPLGYVLLEDDRWVLEGDLARPEGQVLHLSTPVLEEQCNPMLGAAEVEFGWGFDEAHWDVHYLPSGAEIAVPNQALSMLLRLKSIGDKIWLVANLARRPRMRAQWQSLLKRDLALLEREILDQDPKRFSAEAIARILAERENPAASAGILARNSSFALAALTQSPSRALLANIHATLRLFRASWDAPLDENASDPRYRQLFHRIEARQDAEVYCDYRTGVIVEERPAGDSTARPVPEAPYFAHVQLTATCKMTCGHCPYEMTGEVLPLGILVGRLREMAALGVVQVNYGEGAEALLYPALAEALETTRACGMIPNLSTSMTIEPSPRLWNAIETCCGAVAVSIDQYHFHSLMGSGVPRKVAARIQRLVRAGVWVTANIVYETGHWEQALCAIALAADMGVRMICLIRRMRDEDGSYELMPVSDVPYLQSAIRTCRKAGMRLAFHTTDPIAYLVPLGSRNGKEMRPLWTEAFDTIFLDVLGEYRPSALSPLSEQVPGPLSGAWRSQVFNRFRVRHQQPVKEEMPWQRAS